MISNMFILLKKEIADQFKSSSFYIIASLFLLLSGWLFYNYLITSKNLMTLTLSDSILRPLYGNMNFTLLLLSPMITMKSFAEEKKLKTLDLLFQSQLTDWQIVLGKFFSIAFCLFIIIILTIVFPIVLSISGYDDWGSVTTSLVGLFLSALCYLSVGLFASSLTDNIVMAAFSSFVMLMLIMLTVLCANLTDNYFVGQLMQYFSIAFHYEALTRGAVRSFDVVYFVSFVFFFLFLTKKTLGSRNW